MNKKIMLIILLISTISVFAQGEDSLKAPENVVSAFKTAHPKAQEISWDKEGLNYEADYTENGDNYSVVINTLGKILETEKEITPAELPSGVIKYI